METPARLLALIACLSFLASPAWSGEDPFAKLPLPEALLRAGEAKKVVMVDFFTTWCVPCKKLDAETWTDARVREWLAAHAVALKLDAEKEKEAAEKHRIHAYPTMLFLKPDGTELGRIVGFRDPARFLGEAADVLAGRSRLDALRAKLEAAGGNDPMLRQDLGDELADLGRDAEALEQFLWCWDHGLEHSRSFVGVRRSFLLSDIQKLGQRHPPALEALRQRRDACETALMEGKITFELAGDLAALNEKLGNNAGTLRVYDALRVREGLDAAQLSALRHGMFEEVLDELLQAGRYQDALDGAGDLDAAVDSKIDLYESVMALSKDDPLAANQMKWNAVQECSRYYEALLGAGRTEDARALAERLIAFDPRAGTFKALAKRAEKAKADGEAASLRERGKAAAEAAKEEKQQKAGG